MRFVILVIFSLHAITAFAEEGFFLNPPPKLRAAWDNSVMIKMAHASASGTLIRQEKIKNKYYIYVLSAGHLFLDWPNNQPVTPLQGMMVPKLYRNVNIQTTLQASTNFAEITENKAKKAEVEDEKLGKIKFVWGLMNESTKQDKSVIDAGLFVFEEDEPLPNFQPIQIADTSEEAVGAPIFIIGFPAVDLRPDSSQLVKLEKPGVITKRWSKGLFSGDFFLGGENTGLVAGTADTLPGNSGGGIFSQSGHILGVVTTGSSGPEKAYAYDESTPWPVIAAHAQTLRDFVPATIELFKKSLQADASELHD